MSSLSLSPRWLGHLTTILAENKKATNYAFATVNTDGEFPIPRVRHIVHRGILTSHSAQPILISTTDVRSPKVHQLRSHPSKKGPTAEIAWWIAEEVVQFRIAARVHVLPAPSHALHSKFPFSELSRNSGGDSGPDAPETTQDWEALRIRTYNNLSPIIRASFARPVPGSPLTNPAEAEKWPQKLPEKGKEETEEEKKLVKEALENFSLLLLEPLQVDFIEFSVVPNRRTQWSFDGRKWDEQAVVP
ncbi:pyridoxamine 5'-phosphate oxidase-domain-containing protein [Rhizoctonia solani]|nr:pyridoxamine 5'-phosphate oxidase-domain-containing protein [Rhizoctonia solani]